MSFDSYGSFLRQWLETIDIPVSTFAEAIGVNRSTVSNWINQGRHPSHSYHQAALNFMGSDYSDFVDKIGKLKGFSGSEVDVNLALYDASQRLYNEYSEQIREVAPQHGSSFGVFHAHTYITTVTFLRWRDDKRDQPYKSTVLPNLIGGSTEVSIFDEAVVNRLVLFDQSVHRTPDSLIQWNLFTSGFLNLIESIPANYEIIKTSVEHSSGSSIPVTVPISPSGGVVMLRSTTLNGYQKGYERMDARLPLNLTCDQMILVVDFDRILGEAQFDENPKARYIRSDFVDTLDLEMMHSDQDSVYIASHQNPDPNGTISMRWSLCST